MDETLQALLDVGWYNGYEEDIFKITSYIRENLKNSTHINFPDFLDEYDADNYIRIFWSVLVLMYGDYGTSPRFGWLELENGSEILSEIENYLKPKLPS